MRSLVKSVGFMLLGVLQACHDDPNPVVVDSEFLVVNVAADTFDDEVWLLAHDGSEWLDAEPLINGQKVALKGPIGNKSTFTMCTLVIEKNSAGKFEYGGGFSYTEVPVNTAWKFERLVGAGNSNNSKSAQVKVQNFAGTLSRTIISGPDGVLPKTASITSSIATISFSFANQSDFIVSSIYGSTANYAVLKNYAAGATSTVTLKPMDKTLTLSYPGNLFALYYLSGFYHDDDTRKPGYMMSQLESVGVPTGSMQLGYVDGFEKYRTIIAFGTSRMTKHYEKLGAPLTSAPVFADPFFNPGNGNTPVNLSASVSIGFHLAAIRFGSTEAGTNFEWTVLLAGDGSTKTLKSSMPGLPSVIKETYPGLDLEKMKVTHCALDTYLDNFRYNDLLRYHADPNNGSVRRKSDEYFTYGIPL